MNFNFDEVFKTDFLIDSFIETFYRMFDDSNIKSYEKRAEPIINAHGSEKQSVFGLIAMGYCAGLENGYKKALEDLKNE